MSDELKTEELPTGLENESTKTLEQLKAEAAEGLKKEVDDPAELASTMLFLYTPKFNEAVNKLSSNALRRVLKLLVSFPLNEKEYKGTSQVERDVFAVGDRLLEAKFLLIMDNYNKLIQENLPAMEEQKGESNE